MADPKPWKFTQIGGEKKSFTLSGASAPHGRARAKSLVKDAIKLRRDRTYYPGNSQPTTHIFGTMCPDWELVGRFSDSWLGKDGAKAFVSEIKSFVADELPVTIEWGDIIAATGLLDEFEPARESESEVAWRMVVLVDSDDTIKRKRPVRPPASPADVAAKIALQLALLEVRPKSKSPAKMNGSFLDSLEAAASEVQGATGDLLKAANRIASFEQAIAGDVARLRGAIDQVKTTVLTLAAVSTSATQDVVLQRDWAESNIDYYQRVANAEVGLSLALAMMADLDAHAEIAQRGQEGTVYVVRGGDSWESIATTFYGDPDGADKIRQANNAKYGDKPLPGKRIRVPI